MSSKVTHLVTSTVLAVLILGLYFVIDIGSNGPDIRNYKLMDLDSGGASHKSFIVLKLFLQRYIEVNQIAVIFLSTLSYCFVIRRSDHLILALFWFLLVVHLSYSANALFGNILRQGIATIIFITLYNIAPKFSLFSAIIHPALLIVTIFTTNLKVSVRKIVRKKNFLLFFLVGLVFIVFLNDRLEVVLERNISEDYLGALFTFCLLLLRVFIFGNDFVNPQFRAIFLFFNFLLVLLGGEFGQRILISLLFAFDIQQVFYHFNSVLLFKRLLPILLLEAPFRYLVVGNFWGIP